MEVLLGQEEEVVQLPTKEKEEEEKEEEKEEVGGEKMLDVLTGGCSLETCNDYCEHSKKEDLTSVMGVSCPATIQVVREVKTCDNIMYHNYSMPAKFITDQLESCKAKGAKVREIDELRIKANFIPFSFAARERKKREKRGTCRNEGRNERLERGSRQQNQNGGKPY
jgi:hypothetical protein